jgi:hypothetical protein
MREAGKVLKYIERQFYFYCHLSFTIGKAATNSVASWPMPVRQSLRNFQGCEAFIPAFPVKK